MPFIHSNFDQARLYYRDYVPSTKPSSHATPTSEHSSIALVFSAAWPFSSKMWDHLLVPLVETHRLRCIVVDRRGYGHSEWAGSQATIAAGIDYDTFADDLVQVLSSLASPPEAFIGVGASMGCGELLLALERNPYWLSKCLGLVFVGSSLPIPLRTDTKPAGPPREFWNEILEALRDDKLGWFSSKGLPFIFATAKGNTVSATEMLRYEKIADETDPIGVERTVQIFLDRDLTPLLEAIGPKIKVPVVMLQGDQDNVNPIEEGPELVKRFLPTTEIVIYEGGGHGLAQTHREQTLKDIVSLVGRVSPASASAN